MDSREDIKPYAAEGSQKRHRLTFDQLTSLWICLFIIGSAEVVAGPMMRAMGAFFGVPPSSIALIPAAYGIAYAIVALVAGPLSDRIGRKVPLVAGLLGHAAAMSALPQSPNLPIAVTLSGIGGCCAAIIQPNALAMVADMAAPEDLGRRISQVFVGLMTAFVLAPVASGWIAAELGWEYAYYGLAVLALMCCAGVALRCPSSEPPSASLPFLSAHKAALQVPGVAGGLATSFLWLGWCAGFGAIVAEVATRRVGLDSYGAGLLAAWFGIAVIAGNLSSHRLERMMPGQVLPLLAAASAVGILAFAIPTRSPVVFATLGTPWAFGYGAAGPLHHARLNSLSTRWRGTINSYHASLLNLGIFSVATLFAVLASQTSLSVFCLIISASCMFGVAFIPRVQSFRSAVKSRLSSGN